MPTMPHDIFSWKRFAFKYVEMASNNVSLPPNSSKGEICLQICGIYSIKVISHPFLSSTCLGHLLEEGVQPFILIYHFVCHMLFFGAPIR
jgi:hypothetical protein